MNWGGGKKPKGIKKGIKKSKTWGEGKTPTGLNRRLKATIF
jgi:hypothetical protein